MHRLLSQQPVRWSRVGVARAHCVIVTSTAELSLERVTLWPSPTLSVNEMQVCYNLPDLSLAISHYIHEASQGYTACGWDVQGNVSTWDKFCLQLHSSFWSHYLDKSQVVQAFPPSPSHPLGNCDAVLLHRPGDRVVYSMIAIELQLFLLFIYIFRCRPSSCSLHATINEQSAFLSQCSPPLLCSLLPYSFTL